MKRTTLFWIIAIVSTLIFAVYQRVTGPTYPLSGSVTLESKTIKYKLERSHSSGSNYLLAINTGDPSIRGTLYFKKFNTKSDYTEVVMSGSDTLKAELPAQARLQKLDYYIKLFKEQSSVQVPAEKIVTIRFKDDVPLWVLIPHVFAMFFAIIFSGENINIAP